MSLNVVRELPRDQWRRWVEEHPAGNAYHTPEMHEVFARTRGYQPQMWAATDGSGDILALFLPVSVTVKPGVLGFLTTRSVVYGSALCAPSPEGRAALDELLRAYRSDARGRWALFTEVRHVHDASAMRPVLDRNGFRHEEHLNYWIDLDRPANEVWDSILKPGRTAIKRAQSRGTIAEEIHDPACLPVLYGLLQRTYAHAQVPFADPSLFEAVFDILVPRGLVKILMARGDGPYVAVSLELTYKQTIHRWYNGWDKEFHALYPNDLLTWTILEWGAEHGFRSFDFGGAGIPGKPYGPRDFKAKYGGVLVNYGRATCVHRPIALAASRVGFQVYRKTI